jgi:hypothetical protein
MRERRKRDRELSTRKSAEAVVVGRKREGHVASPSPAEQLMRQMVIKDVRAGVSGIEVQLSVTIKDVRPISS